MLGMHCIAINNNVCLGFVFMPEFAVSNAIANNTFCNSQLIISIYFVERLKHVNDV